MQRLLQIATESAWPILQAGLLLTIPLSIASFAIGITVATITALMRISDSGLFRGIARFCVWIFRGTPLLVQLFIVFYGLPSAGIQLDAVPAAIIALSLNTGAYCSESIRASILAIDSGQWQASFALGLTRRQTLWNIIAPQSLRVALPPLSNSFIGLVKDTSLAANITVVEIFMTSQRIAARTYEPLLLYIVAAVVYLLFSTVLSWIQNRMELKFALET